MRTPGAGIGLRAPHLAEIARCRPRLGWLEIHAENYLYPSVARDQMLRLRADYPIALHGTALSLGGIDPLDLDHLGRLADLAALMQPMMISEHLSWCADGSRYLNALLPFPYTEARLQRFCQRVDQVQNRLGRAILVENPANTLRFTSDTREEPDFLAEIVARTGCFLLCDVNNLFVSMANFGGDALAYLDRLPKAAIGAYHLAGHSGIALEGGTLWLDDHAGPVAPAVWSLYAAALSRLGPHPSLIEWDQDLPELSVLLAEADKADALLQAVYVG